MQTRKLDSTFIYVNAHLAYAYTLKGLCNEAAYYADKAMNNLVWENTAAAGSLGWVYAKCGEIRKAEEILTQIQELSLDDLFICIL